MSKYNHSSTIPFSQIPKTELAQAINEWAEDDESLEKLLWTCYNKGVETAGCHAGARPYLQFFVNNSKKDVLRLFDVTIQEKDSQILVCPDGGNPFSGSNWYRPSATVGINTTHKNVADQYFDKLCDELNLDDQQPELEESIPAQLIKLHDFFSGKESGLKIRFIHTEDDKYSFIIESLKHRVNIETLNDLFINSGMQLSDESEEWPFREWTIEDEKLENVLERMKNSIQYITDNYTLELPTSENETTNLNGLAHVMKRQFGDSEEGNKQFEEWLKGKWFETQIKQQELEGAYSKNQIFASGLQNADSTLQRESESMDESRRSGKEPHE